MVSQPKADPDELIHAFRSYSRAIASDVLRKASSECRQG